MRTATSNEGSSDNAGRAIYAIEWRVTLAGEATLRRVRGTVGARAGSTARAAWKWWRVRVAPPWRVRVAPPERVRAAPLKLDRPIVRALPVHNDGGVSRYQA